MVNIRAQYVPLSTNSLILCPRLCELFPRHIPGPQDWKYLPVFELSLKNPPAPRADMVPRQRSRMYTPSYLTALPGLECRYSNCTHDTEHPVQVLPALYNHPATMYIPLYVPLPVPFYCTYPLYAPSRSHMY